MKVDGRMRLIGSMKRRVSIFVLMMAVVTGVPTGVSAAPP